MDIVPSDWSTRHKKLQKMIRKRECFTEAVSSALKLHEEIHMSCAAGGTHKNLIDDLFKDYGYADVQRRNDSVGGVAYSKD